MAVAYQFKMSEKGYFKAIEQVTVCATTKQTRNSRPQLYADQHTYVNKATLTKDCS